MNRIVAHKIYFGFVLLVFTAKIFFSEYFYDLEAVPLLSSKFNWIFSLFQNICLTELTTSKSLAICFHSILLINCLLAFRYNNKTLFPIINSFLLLVYFVIYNSYNPSQNHPLIAMLVLSFAFWTSKQPTFNILINGFRYFILYSFVSAAIWKFVNGGFWYPLQFTTILKHQHIYELTHQANGMHSSFINLLLANPIPTELIYRIATVLQLSFFIGFFTKKYDWLLATLFVVFFLGDLAFMQLSFYETYIALICFYHTAGLETAPQKIKNLFTNKVLLVE